jgi:hypothetical protein
MTAALLFWTIVTWSLRWNSGAGEGLSSKGRLGGDRTAASVPLWRGRHDPAVPLAGRLCVVRSRHLADERRELMCIREHSLLVRVDAFVGGRAAIRKREHIPASISVPPCSGWAVSVRPVADSRPSACPRPEVQALQGAGAPGNE